MDLSSHLDQRRTFHKLNLSVDSETVKLPHTRRQRLVDAAKQAVGYGEWFVGDDDRGNQKLRRERLALAVLAQCRQDFMCAGRLDEGAVRATQPYQTQSLNFACKVTAVYV
jgi:hypothetical protein